MKFREFLLKEDYHIQHRPSEPDDETPSLDKIEGSEIAPDDLFSHPEYYLDASEVTTSELKKFKRYLNYELVNWVCSRNDILCFTIDLTHEL